MNSIQSDVAKELERMYDGRIIFAEKQKFNNLISGEHDNKKSGGSTSVY